MKLQVTANDEMVKKLDKYANTMSVSRSALCAMLIGQGLAGLDKAFGMVDELTMQYMAKAMNEDVDKS